MADYSTLPELEQYYLEDSSVRSVTCAPRSVEFGLSVVLTPAHPLYRVPGPDSQHSYATARLVFSGVESVKWIDQVDRTSLDRNGDRDFGNIDVLTVEQRRFHADGDWGSMDIEAESVGMILDPDGRIR